MLLVLLIIFIGAPLLLAFIAHKIVKRFHPKKALPIGIIVFVAPYLVIATLIYIGNNPGEEFYTEEFEIITELKIPKSANFEYRKSTYPDFHGDYMSAAAISLSKKDFKSLLKKVRKSEKLIKKLDSGSNTYQWIKDKIGNQEYSYYASSSIEDNYHFIGFCKDQKTIIIHLIKW